MDTYRKLRLTDRRSQGRYAPAVPDDPRSRPFDESDADADPQRQFASWFAEARQAGLELPEAMVLATATPEGSPSARVVLLKEHGERGFVFFTSVGSRKGRELEANPRAALLLYWHPLGRQVRIEGNVERLADWESDDYFRTRPRESQLAASASAQSEVVAGRRELERRVADLDARTTGRDVPRPEEWGGFRLVPDRFEFWQHRRGRLHDRLRYRPDGQGWVIERLAP